MRKFMAVGIVIASLWAGSASALPCAGFTDVEDDSPFCPSVVWIKNRNITLGCTATLYCPDNNVTRLQMAAFLQRLGDSMFPLTCATGQVMKWNGTAWVCSNDEAGVSGGGTVTSVMAGTGLQGSPNPIVAAGSINIAPGYQLPQGCTNGQVAKSNGSGGWTCQPDANAGGTVTSVATSSGLTGGPITATGTIGLATTQLLPTTACTNGQVPKWNGTAWACGTDLNTPSGGTVTSVGTGAGLTGGPITGSGTINLAASQLLPTTTCANNQVVKWNGTAWACANDIDTDTNSGGTVTSVGTGTGLTGGPVTGTGTIALATSYQLPQSCSNGQVPKSNGTGGWTCQSDAVGGSGTVTNVATSAGLTGGPITATGTIGLATTQLLPTVECADNQVVKWNGTAWACANDADTNSGGTVTSVGTGTGLTGGPVTTTGTIGVDTAYLQRRVSTACAAGSSIRAIAADGTVTCQTDTAGGDGTVTNVGSGTGLTGGPITTTGTLAVDATYVQRRVSATCAAGSSIRAIAQDGTVTCQTDTTGGNGTVTSVGSGTGLTGGPITTAGTLAVDTAYVQRRVSASCAAGSSIRAIAADGTVTCQTDTTGGSGTVTSVDSGTGLLGGPITSTGSLSVDANYVQRRVSASCAAGSSIRAIAADGTVTCQTDTTGGSGTVTSVGTGAGLTGGPITGTGTIALATTQLLPTTACANNQVAKWNGSAWTCANDSDTNSGGTVTSVATGAGLTGGPITTTGTLGIDTTYVQRRVASSCAAGSSIRAIAEDGTVTCETDDSGAANAFVQNGNAFGAVAVLGTTDNFALDIRVNNERIVRYQPIAVSPNIIAGHPLNSVTAGVRGATISGGGNAPGSDPDWNFEGPNRVTDVYGTIAGGYNNRAGDDAGTVTDVAFAVVGGGFGNISQGFASVVAGGDISIASGSWSTVGGGINNSAGSQGATVAGGGINRADGYYATIPGGRDNTANGNYSFAAGRRAKAQTPAPVVVHDGAFVWADANDFDFHSTANNQFRARTTGGVQFVLGIDGSGNPGYTCSASDGSAWACSSDRNLKQNLRPLDGQAVLAQLRSVPIYAWNPIGRNAHVLHYGPTAQDFHAAFALGDSSLRIGQQDADGVALAAIQGLDQKIDERVAALRAELLAKVGEVEALKRDIVALRTAQQAEVAELRRAVEILMARTAHEGRIAQR